MPTTPPASRSISGTPLDLEATVVHVSPVATSYPRPGGGRNLTMPPAAVISVSTAARGGGGEEASGEGGEVLVTLTAQRKPFHYEADFRALGIEPSSHPLLVVKIGYLVPDLERMAACNLMPMWPPCPTSALAAPSIRLTKRSSGPRPSRKTKSDGLQFFCLFACLAVAQ
jgi:microcystin degradation protein MlrC